MAMRRSLFAQQVGQPNARRIAKIGWVKFTYDANGNLTGDGTTSFGYNDDNQLTSGNGATLTDDPLRRLYSVTKARVTTRFVYDGNNLIAEFDGNGNYVRRYVHRAGVDEPFVWLEGSCNSDRRWLLADERGSIVGVTNGDGVLARLIHRAVWFGLAGVA